MPRLSYKKSMSLGGHQLGLFFGVGIVWLSQGMDMIAADVWRAAGRLSRIGLPSACFRYVIQNTLFKSCRVMKMRSPINKPVLIGAFFIHEQGRPGAAPFWVWQKIPAQVYLKQGTNCASEECEEAFGHKRGSADGNNRSATPADVETFKLHWMQRGCRNGRDV